jgi:hypothetical protein
MNSKIEIAEAFAKIQLCTTADEAKVLYESVPQKYFYTNEEIKNDVKLHYRKHWIALANAEADAKAEACTKPDEAKALHEKAPHGSEAYHVYRVRWVNLSTSLAKACTTTEQAKALYKSIGHGGSTAAEVCFERWTELANAETKAKAEACTTTTEAESLYNDAPLKSKARDIFEARLFEIVSTKAKACKTLGELVKVRKSEKRGSLANSAYWKHLIELADSIAINTVMKITTVKEAEKKADSQLYSPWRSEAREIYLARAEHLRASV